MAPICIVLASLAATINDLVIINRRRANSDFVFRKSLHRRILARHLARSLPEFAKMDTTKSKWPRLCCSCFIGSYYWCINNDQKMKVYFGLCVPQEAARSDLGAASATPFMALASPKSTQQHEYSSDLDRSWLNCSYYGYVSNDQKVKGKHQSWVL